MNRKEVRVNWHSVLECLGKVEAAPGIKNVQCASSFQRRIRNYGAKFNDRFARSDAKEILFTNRTFFFFKEHFPFLLNITL